ncbi:MAG: hypothetical protein F6K39_46665 [Okeania sp. SIO3B3]|nr:hypothetical protein [Okeania sp. SIO3B3]
MVEKAAGNYQRPKGKLWVMIVGGSSRSHPYTESDWGNLASGMNELARRLGIRWLLTTSRRTGKATELVLEKNLDKEFLADAIWWADKPERRMMAFLGSSERAFVTQDSVTMVTECVASGKPTVVLQPRDETFPKNSFMPRYLENLEEKNRIVRLPIARLAQFQNPTEPRATLLPIEFEMAKDLRARLGLNDA